MDNHVHFFSKDDLSVGYNLSIAEKRIIEISEGNIPSEIDGVVELWHIRHLFKENCRLQKWADEEYNLLKTKVDRFDNIIAQFFNQINPNNLRKEYESLQWGYRKAFWEIIDSFKLYKIIDKDILRDILADNHNNLYYVLSCKGLVEKFKGTIREVLINDNKSAELLLDEYTKKKDRQASQLFFPSNLTIADKEQIIDNYLDGKEPNLNYVRLVSQVKNSNDGIILSPQTRLKAEKLASKINDDFWKNNPGAAFHWSTDIYFTDEAEQALDVSFNDTCNNIKYTYSVKYIEGCDNIQRIGNCACYFGWLNEHGLLDLVNKPREANTIEQILIDTGRFSYQTNSLFQQKNWLALYQLHGYNNILKKLNSSFETELKQFYEIYLKEEFGYSGLTISFPREDYSALEKCRIIFPNLDDVVKQYNSFVEYDDIDRDLIRLSNPVKVEDGISLFKNKYYELVDGNNELCFILWDLFGASNSLLSYVEPFKEKNYHSFVDLLQNEDKVLYNNYQDFQKPNIDRLIDKSIISVDNEGELHITNDKRIGVLKELWEYRVCSYWHYDEPEQRYLDELCAKGWVTKDGHLLSKPERDYFSYYLDNSKFTNGPALRNHYAHGSNPPADDENTHMEVYLVFLRLLTIIIIKIYDDLWLVRKAIAINDTKKRKELLAARN
ncbi:MAG: hypothetical protein J6T88_03005 [Bacteroidales bacterium]|nr:hypothetical protein [Bacteroidales bacterium]